MRWRKLGRVYVPDGASWWAKTHGFPPTPVRRDDGTLRLYLSFCDEHMVGRLGYVDVDAADPTRVLSVSDEPIFGEGEPGTFDENGVVPTSIVRVGDELYLYYVGYQIGQKVRYYQFEGLAVSGDGGETFVRRSRVPVLDRTNDETLNRTSAFVMHDEGIFRLWYVGGSEWTVVDGKPLPVYGIKYAESADGVTWPPAGRPAIELAGEDEHALGRPWVVRTDEGYRMWYSSRTRSLGYRIGFADSTDGRTWTRRDSEAGIDVSADGWDSEMVCYASVVDLPGGTYMFYNGNSCGRTGFGCAVLDDADGSSR